MPVEEWAGAAFHDEALGWVAERLETHGLALVGDWEQPHARPWSTAMRVETTGGRCWFKANGAGTRHEPTLLSLLATRLPGLVPAVLAVDVDAGWSLSRDGGPMLRSVLEPDQSWAAWEGIVVDYAQAQLALADDQGAVLACGVEERSPRTLPGQVRDLVDELSRVAEERGGLSGEDRVRLEGLLPAFDRWCAELAASPVPDSLQHDDLHSGNVCWPGDGSARVIDWGDASWGSPLGTMLNTMNSLAFHAGIPVEGQHVDDPRVLRVRDAFLEPFTPFGARDDLVHGVDLARRTGCVVRALSWRAAMSDVPPSANQEYDYPVREWLLELTASDWPAA
jgi:hypothetical protein